MRTVYLGTSEFAATVLARLAGSQHRPALVITRPDRPKGRGRRLASPPVADAARALGLELRQPESVNDEAVRGEIAAAGPEALLVCAFGVLIREPLLSTQPILNVHPSLLPRWRGAAPVERALMAGDAETGVSIMRLTEGLDSGPVGLRKAVAIAPQDTYGTLAPRLAALGGELLARALDAPTEYAEQDEAGVTYAEKITLGDRMLDPGRSAVELERTVRALTPHIGTRLVLLDGSMLGVHAARAVTLGGFSSLGTENPLAVDGRLLLRCAEGALELLAVQPPGGRPMSAADYLRGHRAQ